MLKLKNEVFMIRKLLILSVFISFTGCASFSPYAQDFNVISVAQEQEMGAQMAGEISKQMTLVSDAKLNQKVNQIGQRLVAALPDKQFNYTFKVVQDASPNAFTIPAGQIYVHTGLLNFVSDDYELAGVLAHEIGHAYERHPAKGMSRYIGVQTLSQLLFKDSQNRLGNIAINIAQNGALMKYGRDDERESDELGFYLLKRAGYPPDGLRRFLTKLDQLAKSGSGPSFLSSHPPTPERIARLKALESGQTGSISASQSAYNAFSS